MNNRLRAGIIGAVVTAVGGIVAALIGVDWAAEDASPSSPDNLLAIHGNGNQLSGNTVVNGSHNTIVNSGVMSERLRATSSLLVGTWKGVSRYDVPEGELTSVGHSQFLQTGDYNFSGEFITRNAKKLGLDTEIASKISAAGTWRIAEGKYSIILTEIKTVKNVMRRPGKVDIDLDSLAASVPGASRFRLEDVIPRGASQEYAVVELTPTSLHATGQDLPGNGINYTAIRVQ
ncbi:hypothetical protein J2W28_003689 [Variovorax boronicumulans]|uniref:hypothetical protein n=1 Tax=Variovorax boronicumulans TaxID=436515 RepID=UPI00277EEBF5|nr:hypothetical protein [Variovorax boronicumulans]MDP9993015.1 hypothetical protein [Variovorax boronicumulans]MDQ0004537.1 hypothetical protein [Variovorax boronicumulans]